MSTIQAMLVDLRRNQQAQSSSLHLSIDALQADRDAPPTPVPIIIPSAPVDAPSPAFSHPASPASPAPAFSHPFLLLLPFHTLFCTLLLVYLTALY